jgi:hypothetical protein
MLAAFANLACTLSSSLNKCQHSIKANKEAVGQLHDVKSPYKHLDVSQLCNGTEQVPEAWNNCCGEQHAKLMRLAGHERMSVQQFLQTRQATGMHSRHV